MRRFGAACTLALVALFVAAGCNDYGSTFQGNTGAVLTVISPSNIDAGGPDFTITVQGVGFVAKTVVQWNGTTIVSTPVTDTAGNVLYMTAVVPAALTATPGRAFVNTLNPHSGQQDNGLSNTIAFIVNPKANPIPVLSSMTPSTVPAGNPDFTITLTGTDFVPPATGFSGSVIHWNAGPNQTTITPTSVSATQIVGTVPASLVTTDGTAVVTVYTPPAPNDSSNPSGGGGGTSANGLTFTIGNGGSSDIASALQVAEETPAVSADGRYVAYAAGDGKHMQIFVRDTCQSAASDCQPKTSPVSVAEDGITAGIGDSHNPSISADGRYIAFSSAATNLLANSPGGKQIFVRDTCLGATSGCAAKTQLVSVDPSGKLGATENLLPSISSSGRFIAFLSVTPSTNSKDAASTNSKTASKANTGFRQVFIRDTCLGAADGCTPQTTRISVQPGDTSSVTGKPAGPAVSGKGSNVGISGAKSVTALTRGVTVDDQVFLAITGEKQN